MENKLSRQTVYGEPLKKREITRNHKSRLSFANKSIRKVRLLLSPPARLANLVPPNELEHIPLPLLSPEARMAASFLLLSADTLRSRGGITALLNYRCNTAAYTHRPLIRDWKACASAAFPNGEKWNIIFSRGGFHWPAMGVRGEYGIGTRRGRGSV